MSDAFSIIGEVASQVTFDELMRRNPETYTPAERMNLIRLRRQQRAAADHKAAQRKAKREGAEE